MLNCLELWGNTMATNMDIDAKVAIVAHMTLYKSKKIRCSPIQMIFYSRTKSLPNIIYIIIMSTELPKELGHPSFFKIFAYRCFNLLPSWQFSATKIQLNLYLQATQPTTTGMNEHGSPFFPLKYLVHQKPKLI